ncbi:unnamed protein product [Adineta steineri]|uniref:Uncharacterized protein n=2 Tax=Adineta steineri TaxID=433720 RepID=A0A818HXY6_9BILA|nr:unnamed protein product [Adineta steineri]CAF3511401.1 unnamed protein product [Adineta steineri]
MFLDNNMECSVLDIDTQLQIYETELNNDYISFNDKLNLTRTDFFDNIHRLIKQLNDMKKEYEDKFRYLEHENKKTCDENQQQFNNLNYFLKTSENNQENILRKFNEFKGTFPMRPNMLKNIPEFNFQDMQIDYFIKQKLPTNHTEKIINNDNESILKVDRGSSPIIFHEQLLIEQDQSSNSNQNLSNHDQILPETSSLCVPMTSIIQNNPTMTTTTTLELPSRPVSRNRDVKNMVNTSFRIPYESNRNSRLMAYNIHEHSLLIYSLTSHKLEYLSIQTREINSIDLSFKEPLINLDYCINHRCFYLITKHTHHFCLFHLNEQKIEIDQQFELTHENNKINSIINGHIYENNLFFLYTLPSKDIHFGRYNFDESIFFPSIQFKNILHDDYDELTYDIIDFTVNNTFITFLTQIKKSNRYMLIINDHDINQISSFDLVDAKQPLSIISIIKPSESASSHSESQLLLFINDPKSHFIHCCTYERYVISIEVNSFGICSLNDGNLAIVTNQDVRALKVQEYLEKNHIQIE